MYSPPNHSRLFWFLLTDTSGHPYRSTATVTSVSITVDSVIDQFRDAVKLKHSNKLSSFDAADLLVYKNRASLDNKESPLDPTLSIGQLGDKQDILIVVVPQPQPLSINSVYEPNSVQDVSMRLYEELTRPFETEPALDQLKQALRSKPLVQIPLDPRLHQPLQLIVSHSFANFEFSNFFRFSTDETFDLSHLLVEIAKMPHDLDHNGESTLHYYVDLFMKRILKGLLRYDTMSIHVARNISDTSFTTNQSHFRPDFLFYVNSFLILRGEEKKIKSELMDAKAELSNKLKSWNPVIFGGLNYIFGFACAGEHFQLCAMGPSGTVTDISQVFDLQQVHSRYELFFCIINLARLMKTILVRIPRTSIMLYNPIKRPNGVTIEIGDDIIIKTIPVWGLTKKNTLDFLNQLYTVMKRNSVPYVCECKDIHIISKMGTDQEFIQLKIAPHGCEMIPPTLNLLLRALQCILRALEGVHKLGYAHCDVRWPNILRVSDDYWMLIDFENAAHGNEELFQKDIYMVGRLIDTCTSIMTMAVSGFRNTLVSETPPGATEALSLLADLSQEIAEEAIVR